MKTKSPLAACVFGLIAAVYLDAADEYTTSILAGRPGFRGFIDGAATTARFMGPSSGTLDANGNLYVAEWGTIRRITPAGDVATIAGSPGVFGYVDGMGSNARFSSDYFPIAADAAGNVYAVDRASHTVRKVTAAGEVTTLAGSPRNLGYVDGVGGQARFNSPSGIAVDREGRTFVSDTTNRAIRRITPTGEVTTLVRGVVGAAGDVTYLAKPSGLAIDEAGILYVYDVDERGARGTISRVTPAGTVTQSRWGPYSWLYYEDPLEIDLKVDAAGNLYVLSPDGITVFRFNPEGAETARFQPSATLGSAPPFSPAITPLGLLAVGGSGAVFLFENGAIRKELPVLPLPSVPIWSQSAYTDAMELAGVAFGNGTFVLAGSGDFWPLDDSPYVYTSTDGSTWTRRSTPGFGTAFPPRYVNGRFFIGIRSARISNGGSTQAAGETRILSSADGAKWDVSGVLKGGVGAPVEFAHGNGVYVAVGSGADRSTDVILTSNDGIDWTPRTINGRTAFFGAESVVFFRGRFFATTSTTGGSDTSLYTSEDALTWTLVSAAPANPRGLAASDSLLLMMSGDGLVPGLVQSSDGETFSPASRDAGVFPGRVRYLNGAFVTAETEGPSGMANAPVTIRASYDGRTWSTVGRVFSGSSSLRDFDRGNSRYVVVTGLRAFTGTTDFTPGGVPLFPVARGYFNNFSVRGRTGTGPGWLTIGLTISGPSSGDSKRLLVRGVGPTLAQFGVPGVLADPQLAWGNGENGISGNDDWNGNPDVMLAAATAGAFVLPAGSKDAALVVPGVRPGRYSVQISGVGGGTGITLGEVYDLTAPSTSAATGSRLTRLSAQTQLGGDGDLLIAGFEVAGDPVRVLVRALGPTLGQFGASGFLPDPQLAIFRGDVLVAANDNWDPTATPAPLQTGTGAFPLLADSKDAVLVATLPVGGYTVQVSGAGGATGTALVEVFEIQ